MISSCTDLFKCVFLLLFTHKPRTKKKTREKKRHPKILYNTVHGKKLIRLTARSNKDVEDSKNE